MKETAHTQKNVSEILMKTTTFGTLVKDEYCYVPILKNAHSSGTEFFKNHGYIRDENIHGKKYIVFLRDPIERWISGATEWLINNVDDPQTYVLEPLVIKLIFDSISLDAHTFKQIDYLFGLPVSDCVFFNLNDIHFTFKLRDFTCNVLGFNDFVFPKLNTSTENQAKININDQLNRLVQENNDLRRNLHLFYLPDYQFIRSITYYDKNA